MFHVKQWILNIVMLVISVALNAQGTISLEDKTFSYDTRRVARVDDFLAKFPVFEKLRVEEQDAFYWTNVLRADPPAFLKTYVLPFLNQFPEAKGSSANSLIKD